jgi:hypothetical protein
VPNELVLNDLHQSMQLQIYIQNIDGSARSQNAFSSGTKVCENSSDFVYVNSVDTGPQNGTPLAWPGDQRSQACRDWTAQFGPTFSNALSRIHAGHSWPIQGQSRNDMAQPYPDPIAAGSHWEPGWNTIMYHLKFPTQWETRNGTLEAWIWHPGDDGWQKLFQRFDVVGRDPGAVNNGITLNGGTDGFFHWGLWLTPFRTGGVSEAGVRPDTYIIYDEVIVSTSPIDAPNVVKPDPPENLRGE